MNAREFYLLTKEVRKAQRIYYKTRDFEQLKKCKHLERILDEEIERIESLAREPRLEFKNPSA